MKKVEELKAGMEVWIKFRVEENNDNLYVFRLKTKGSSFSITKGLKQFPISEPLEMFTIDENEIPELKGVEMEVSDDEIHWVNRNVCCKINGWYVSDNHFIWKHARPIQKTFDLTNVPEHLLTDELKQYLTNK